MNRDFIRPSLAPGVSPEHQVALVRVAEECSELGKEAGKALRFGQKNRFPADGPTNDEKMGSEFRDVIEALRDAGVFMTVGTFSGAAFQRLAADPSSSCVCCPGFPRHLYAYGVQYDEGHLYEIEDSVRKLEIDRHGTIDQFINDHFKVPGIAGRRVRVMVAVEVLDSTPLEEAP